MNIGFKTGPKNWESEGRALAAEAAVCEVWFDVRRDKEYREMLAELAHQEVRVGLHHWGLVDGKYKTNLATNVRNVREATIEQIKRTIDRGADIDCGYVNAHPGARWLEEQQFSPWRQKLVPGSETEAKEARELFLMAVEELQTYAADRGVLLTMETLPAREVKFGHGQRDAVYDPGNMSLEVLEEMVQSGGWLANDITHTIGQLAVQENDRAFMRQELLAFSRRVAEGTRVLHVNTVSPPFNGTDSHDGITPEDFDRGVFPDSSEVRDWLAVFSGRGDVFVIPEPQDGTAIDNYRALEAMTSGL